MAKTTQLCTFAHVADLLFEDVVSVLVHVGPQEVLEAVVDLEARGRHGHPLPDRVALQVLQVLYALNHILVIVLWSPVCRSLRQSPLASRPLLILIFTV